MLTVHYEPIIHQECERLSDLDLAFPRVAAAANRVRAGRDLTPARWPGSARVAVALSFDVDAETYSLYTGNFSPQQLSRGAYGPRVGLPRILGALERQRVPASFFIPAVSAQLHPQAVEAETRLAPET